jgi:hypothetical protein
MSYFIPKHLIRRGLGLLVTAAAVGCSSGDGGTEPGAIALAILPTSATINQGGSQAVAATLTRSGGFNGTVNLTVTGQPTGVTGVVSNVVTTGTTTTATVTINVDAATAVGDYPLVVHGTGTGVTEATAAFALTVAAAPAFTLTLNPTTLSIAQGASTPTTTVTLVRTNFTGNVALSVENLPTGVTASFAPASPISGNTSVLTLTVAGNAPTGTFTNLLVRAAAAPLTDRTAPLSLTITAAAPSFALSLTLATLSIAQGASTPTTTVNIARTNFTGDVTLSVLNLPTGVTASFAPPNPQTGTSSVLTLTVAAGAPTGTFTNLSVQGVGSTGTVSTPLTLTIAAGIPAGNFTLTTTPLATVGVTQGLSANVTVNINRTGGNTSDVALTFTGTLPTGMTLAFVPTSTTGNSSVLTITTTVATPVGSYPIVIHGNTTGLGEQLVNLNIVVTAPTGSGNVSLSFAACAVADRAVWVAYQDGSGAWVRVVGVNDLYQFNITQSKGGIAYVVTGTGTSEISVLYFSQAEMTAATLNFCGAAASGKTVNATVANLPGGAQGRVSFGGGFGLALANGPVQLTNVLDGLQDVVGYAGPLLAPTGSDRVFLARGLNPPNGGSIGTVDFTGTGSSLAAAASITLAGGVGGAETYSQSMSYLTGAACVPGVLYSIGGFVGSPFTAYGVGAASQVATDFHSLTVTAINGTSSFRLVTQNNHTLAARTLTLPSVIGTVTASDAGGPYKRLMLVTTLPADLNSSAVAGYTDATVTGKSGFIIATAAWLGGLNVSLTLPDFSALAGWSNAWAPATGDSLDWSFSGSTVHLVAPCDENARFASSTKLGTL